MPQPSFKSAVRQQESLLAPLEKKTLLWLARRMPAWVNSDQLTLLGFLGMILAGVCYFLAKWKCARPYRCRRVPDRQLVWR